VSKTLLRYIGLDLLKTTGLTLVVLTLALTMVGIIEPLRKEGLDASQVLFFFGMTLPVMLSFTLPFAALFATCFVYGRFSQDNELLASRASGISTLALLRPALLLGMAVTAASWSMSNNLAPMMVRRGAEALTSNIRGIMCRKLDTKGFVGFQDMTIHADRVFRYPNKDYDKLEGVIVIRSKDKTGDVEIMSAKSARARFGINHETLKAFVNITLDHAVLMYSENPSIRTHETFPINSISFDRRIKEKPAWYSWTELSDRLADPSKSLTVLQAIPKIQQYICSDIFVEHVLDTLQTTGSYDKFTRHNELYVIKAPKSSSPESGKIVLESDESDKTKLVRITEIRDGKPARQITASNGEIRISWGKFTKAPEVTITLNSNVIETDLTISETDPTGLRDKPVKETWQIGQMRIPAEILTEIDKITPHEAFANGGEDGGLTENPLIHKALEKIKSKHVVKLIRDIKSEMHMRLAYSSSCMLMVMLGGVLGLIFRGGQFVSALFTAVLPAALVIVTILMGKNIAQNPGSSQKETLDASITMGLVVIWGGIALLAVITGFVYWRVSKK
jgi:lipopolysaccharide export LptBFGC system permease protein LptF